MIGLAWAIIGLVGAFLLGLGIWLKAEQRRFIAQLRAEDDPLADAIGTKQFRQKFQAHLFGLETGRPGKALLTLLLVLLLGALVVYSFLPDLMTGGPG